MLCFSGFPDRSVRGLCARLLLQLSQPARLMCCFRITVARNGRGDIDERQDREQSAWIRPKKTSSPKKMNVAKPTNMPPKRAYITVSSTSPPKMLPKKRKLSEMTREISLMRWIGVKGSGVDNSFRNHYTVRSDARNLHDTNGQQRHRKGHIEVSVRATQKGHELYWALYKCLPNSGVGSPP